MSRPRDNYEFFQSGYELPGEGNTTPARPSLQYDLGELLEDASVFMLVFALVLATATVGIICWKVATAPTVPSTHMCQPVESENPGGLWRCWNPDHADYGG